MRALEKCVGILIVIGALMIIDCFPKTHPQPTSIVNKNNELCSIEPTSTPLLCDRVTPDAECAICVDDSFRQQIKNCYTLKHIYCAANCDAPECGPRKQTAKP